VVELRNDSEGIRLVIFPAARHGLAKLRLMADESVQAVTLRVDGQPVELVEPFQDGLAFVRSDDILGLGSRETRVELMMSR
jgi:hypothetical protein